MKPTIKIITINGEKVPTLKSVEPTENEKKIDAVIVKKSNIENAGDGVFINPKKSKIYKKDDVICFYGGLIYNDNKVDKEIERMIYQNHGSAYMLSLTTNETAVGYGPIDRYPELCKGLYVGQMMCDNNPAIGKLLSTPEKYTEKTFMQEYKKNVRKHSNVIINDDFQVIATKQISPGDELYFSYGYSYWLGNFMKIYLENNNVTMDRLIDLLEKFSSQTMKHIDFTNEKILKKILERGDNLIIRIIMSRYKFFRTLKKWKIFLDSEENESISLNILSSIINVLLKKKMDNMIHELLYNYMNVYLYLVDNIINIKKMIANGKINNDVINEKRMAKFNKLINAMGKIEILTYSRTDLYSKYIK